MPNDFDKASRYAFKIDPVGMLCWSMGIEAGDFVFRDWLDTRDAPFPGHPDRTGDTVAAVEEVRTGGVPWALAVEFQIEPDPLMFGRMLGYLSGLWLNLKPDPERGSRYNIGGVVLNLTGNGNGSREMVWMGSAVQTRLGLCERNLESESASDTLDAVEAGRVTKAILPWIPLMRRADSSDIMERWKRIAETETSERTRYNYAGLAAIFADACERKGLWIPVLRSLNVNRRSSVADEWRVEGAIESQRKAVRTGLDVRFGRISTEIDTILESTTDLAVLDRWLRTTYATGSVEEMLQQMRNEQPTTGMK